MKRVIMRLVMSDMEESVENDNELYCLGKGQT